jgi:hypothetical protein
MPYVVACLAWAFVAGGAPWQTPQFGVTGAVFHAMFA